MAIQQLGNERTTAYTDGPDLVMERIFDAPRDLVWKVMNDPERVTDWWGPRGYTTTVEEMDVRPGGRWRWINHTTGGEDAPFKGEYLEVPASAERPDLHLRRARLRRPGGRGDDGSRGPRHADEGHRPDPLPVGRRPRGCTGDRHDRWRAADV